MKPAIGQLISGDYKGQHSEEVKHYEGEIVKVTPKGDDSLVVVKTGQRENKEGELVDDYRSFYIGKMTNLILKKKEKE